MIAPFLFGEISEGLRRVSRRPVEAPFTCPIIATVCQWRITPDGISGIESDSVLTGATRLMHGSSDPAGCSQRSIDRAARNAQSTATALGLEAMKTNAVNGGHLRSFIERIEKLEEEKRAIADDIKDVYGEAKGTGFDIKVMRKIVSLRRQDKSKRQEEAEILDLYLSALGMVE
jgi:uncharacterized protein (UPF0335 family)